MDPVDVVRQWQERGWGEGDLSAVDDLIGEVFTRHTASGTATRSREQLKADLHQYQRALHQPSIEVHERVVDGELVWSRTTMRGCNLETGEERSVDALQIHRVVDGLIVEAWSLHAAAANWD
jgi:mannose-6-phosphate isomerase class I